MNSKVILLLVGASFFAADVFGSLHSDAKTRKPPTEKEIGNILSKIDGKGNVRLADFEAMFGKPDRSWELPDGRRSSHYSVKQGLSIVIILQKDSDKIVCAHIIYGYGQ